jgi:hypothetical protein
LSGRPPTHPYIGSGNIYRAGPLSWPLTHFNCTCALAPYKVRNPRDHPSPPPHTRPTLSQVGLSSYWFHQPSLRVAARLPVVLQAFRQLNWSRSIQTSAAQRLPGQWACVMIANRQKTAVQTRRASAKHPAPDFSIIDHTSIWYQVYVDALTVTD